MVPAGQARPFLKSCEECQAQWETVSLSAPMVRKVELVTPAPKRKYKVVLQSTITHAQSAKQALDGWMVKDASDTVSPSANTTEG